MLALIKAIFAALFGGKLEIPAADGPATTKPDGLPWLTEAFEHLGLKEVPGSKHNPAVVDFWRRGKAGDYTSDETAWCAAFVSACLEDAGVRSARTGWALSYLNWGTRVSAAVGAVVVFERTGGGHVGFVVGRTRNNELVVLGGNQSNAVNKAAFPVGRARGYRWPKDVPLPTVQGFASLPFVEIGVDHEPSTS